MAVPWHAFVGCQPVRELTAWFWPAMQATTPVRGLQHVVPTFPVVQLFQAPAGTAPGNPYPQFVPLYQPGSQVQFLGPQPAFVPPQPQWPVQPRPAIPPRGSNTGWRSVVPRPNSIPRHPGGPQGAANPQAGGIPGPSHGGRSNPAGSVPAGGAAGMHSSRGPAAVPPGHHPRHGPSTRGVSDEPLLRHAATQPRSVAGGLQQSDLERWLPHYRKWQQTERDFVGDMRACSCCGRVGFGGRHTTLHHKMGKFTYPVGEEPVGLLANPFLADIMQPGQTWRTATGDNCGPVWWACQACRTNVKRRGVQKQVQPEMSGEQVGDIRKLVSLPAGSILYTSVLRCPVRFTYRAHGFVWAGPTHKVPILSGPLFATTTGEELEADPEQVIQVGWGGERPGIVPIIGLGILGLSGSEHAGTSCLPPYPICLN